MLYLQPSRTPGLLTAQAEYQARILPALAGQLRLETTHCGHTRPGIPHPERAMTGTVLRQALAYARRGWPVFPCQPGQKIPATTHGFRDATTDEEQITAWFTRHPRPEPGHRHRRPRPRRPGRRPARPTTAPGSPPSPGFAAPGC